MGSSRQRARYEVVWEHARRWRLDVNGQFVSRHTSSSAACAAAGRIEGRTRTRRAMARNVAIVLVASLVWATAAGSSEVDNPLHRAPAAMTERMSSAFLAVESGTALIEDFTSAGAGFEGAEIDVTQDFGNAGSFTEPDPSGPIERRYLVVMGAADERCYFMRWQAGQPPMLAVLTPELDCVPSRAVASHSAIDDVAVNATGRELDWAPVLPSPTMLAGWFIPLVTVLSLASLTALVDISIRLMRRNRGGVAVTVTVHDREEIEALSGGRLTP